MNISECRQALSYIYSTHPNAQTPAKPDKERMVASYFRVLYRYSLKDVLDAIDKACAKKPAFIPTAYEIESNVEKTIDVERFLPPEYYELDKDLYQYKCENIYAIQTEIRAKYRQSEDPNERELLLKKFEDCEKRIEIDAKLKEMYSIAENKAIEYYDNQNSLGGNDEKIKEITG